MTSVTDEQLRKEILVALQQHTQMKPVVVTRSIVESALSALSIPAADDEMHQRALTIWFDLFKSGMISFGENSQNLNLNICHLTHLGGKALSNFSRDPFNSAGYLAAIESSISHNAVVMAYVREGIATFNSGHDMAAAVLIGIATEVLVLELAELLNDRMEELGFKAPDGLTDWKAKTVADAIDASLRPHRKQMPSRISDRFDSIWRYIALLRLLRNEVGHPCENGTVLRADVHGNYMYFHAVAELLFDLRGWVTTGYGIT